MRLPAALLGFLALLATGCSSPVPPLGLASSSPGQEIPTSGREYFPSSLLGVSASPRHATGRWLPRGGGQNKIGAPYKVAGKRYVPTGVPDDVETGVASWYGSAFHGRRTANGEVYDMNRLSAAHRTMPLPSYARVTNLENGRSLVVRVNDRGPFSRDRVIDLSKRAAELLGYTRQGTAQVKVEYAGRAPLHGEDDRFLAASLRDRPAEPGSGGYMRGPSGYLIAMNGRTPSQRASAADGLAATVDNIPQAVPLPGRRPAPAAGGISVSAYADMRVSGAFSWSEDLLATGTGWKGL